MKRLFWGVLLLFFLLGCNSYEVPLIIGEGVGIYWGQDGWIENRYSYPIRVYCYRSHSYPSVLGAGRTAYRLRWIKTVRPGERESIRYVNHNDHFKIYDGKGSLLEALDATSIWVSVRWARINGIATAEELYARLLEKPSVVGKHPLASSE